MAAVRRRPTLTIVVPHRQNVDRLIALLLDAGHTFTCEKSVNEPDVWHVGLLDDAVPLVEQAFAGRLRDAGTLGDHLREDENGRSKPFC